MNHASPEAQERFERWHLKQRAYGACRCPECRAEPPALPLGLESQALAHAEWRAKLLRSEADVAVRSAEAAEFTLAKLREKLHE